MKAEGDFHIILESNAPSYIDQALPDQCPASVEGASGLLHRSHFAFREADSGSEFRNTGDNCVCC